MIQFRLPRSVGVLSLAEILASPFGIGLVPAKFQGEFILLGVNSHSDLAGKGEKNQTKSLGSFLGPGKCNKSARK